MKRKLICTFMAVFMSLASTSVFAVKRPAETNNTLNVLESFGSFNSEEALGSIITRNASATWVKDGAPEGSGGAMKVEISDVYGYACVDVPNVIGETLDISFYAKVAAGTASFSVPMRFESQTYGKTQLSGQLSAKWKKYSFTYYCDGLKTDGTSTQEPLRLFCLRGDDLVGNAYFLDELTVTPHGDVEYDWASANIERETASRDVIPEDDGFATEQPVNSVTFSDTSGHWSEQTVNILASSGIVSGMGDGNFQPDGSVTRAQFVTLAMNLMMLDPLPYRDIYKDVKSSDWFAGDLQSAYNLGFINPIMTAGDNFLPDQPITREEAAYILSKVGMQRGAKPKKEAPVFSDDGTISSWAKEAVTSAAQFGMLSGYPDGSFRPESSISRGEAAAMIYRLIENYSKMAVFVDGINGSDENDGTESNPVATVEAARKLVQPYLSSMQNHIYVFIKGGTYFLNSPMSFSTADSGNNGFSVIYTAWGEKKPVFSGGREYKDFVLHDAEKNIYKTYVGTGTIARQIYINGVRAIRSMNDPSKDGYLKRTGVLKNPVKDLENRTVTCDNPELAELTNQDKIEAVYCEEWTNPRIKIERIYLNEEGKCVIKFQDASFDLCHTPANTKPSDGPMWLENAYELINAEGEWYLNESDGYLYYKPRENEDPATMVATVPVLNHGLLIVGDDTDNKIHNLKFDKLIFESYAWNWPSTEGQAYSDGQLNNLSSYLGDGRITGTAEDAAVTLADAAYVDITNCTVRNVGGAGIGFRQIYQHCDLVGNHVYNTAGGGINVGCAAAEASNIDKFRKPKEYRYFRIDCNILNNNIHDCGLDYRGCVGLSISWLKNSDVSYNEIYNINYSGMHIGWGWASYASSGSATVGLNLTYNYIHDTCKDFICDSGGIYTLGATGGWEGNYNKICNNYFENMRGTPTAIYPDEGSTYWEIANNVVDVRQTGLLNNRKYTDYDLEWLCIHTNTIRHNWVHDNFATTGKYRLQSDGNDFTNAEVYPDGNWPETARSIIDEAGLQAYYQEQFPDTIQRLRVLNRKDIYSIKSGETLTVDIVGYKRRLNEVKIPYDQLYFYSTDETVATVDENGVITGVGSGRCNIHAQYLDGDVYRDAYIEVLCDDFAVDFKTEQDFYYVLQGSATDIGAVAVTMSGLEVPAANTAYTVENPEIASISEDGLITGLQTGSTTIHAVFDMDGVKKEMDIPVHVVRYAQDDTLDFLDSSVKLLENNSFFTAGKWTEGATEKDGGISISSSKPSYFLDTVQNELISFDLTINNPNSWPSLTLGIKNKDWDYTTGDTYLIGFKPDIIELQRFNKGERTMIFGDASFSPIGGAGYPNLLANGETMFEYGKRYSITVGTIDEDNGTRIILIVNDQPVFDFLDQDEARITGGLFGVYAFQGNFLLQPYTEQKFKGE